MRRILGFVISSAAALAMVGAATASAATVVVRPSAMDSWATQTRDPGGVPVASNDPYCHGSVNFVTGPATPPLGVGSAELKTGNGTTGGDCSAELRNSAYSGVKLNSLTGLSYWTYDVTNNGQQFPYLELNIDTTGTGASPDDALFFEPPYQSSSNGGTDCAHQAITAMNTWQQWDALHGCWWSNDGDLNPGTGTGTLADYLAVYPNATIVNSSSGGGVHLVVGFASPGRPVRWQRRRVHDRQHDVRLRAQPAVTDEQGPVQERRLAKLRRRQRHAIQEPRRLRQLPSHRREEQGQRLVVPNKPLWKEAPLRRGLSCLRGPRRAVQRATRSSLEGPLLFGSVPSRWKLYGSGRPQQTATESVGSEC